MPMRARTPCRAPGCPEMAVRGTGRCGLHQRPREDVRPSARQRGYTTQWEKLRKMVLRSEPLCRDPYGLHARVGEVVAATLVDHIRPLAAGGSNARENLQPLCRKCHAVKTAEDQKISGG